MAGKINDIELQQIDNNGERIWFSVIKNLAKETNFGNVDLSLTIKNGKVTNIANTRIKRNFNIGG